MADAVINLVMGILLLVYPRPLIEWLGVPIPESNFYANILGAVLFGIGLALFMEYSRGKSGLPGLGIGGAMVINICGAGVLALWLIFGDLYLPPRGYIFLWFLTLLVLGICLVEFINVMKHKESTE